MNNSNSQKQTPAPDPPLSYSSVPFLDSIDKLDHMVDRILNSFAQRKFRNFFDKFDTLIRCNSLLAELADSLHAELAELDYLQCRRDYARRASPAKSVSRRSRGNSFSYSWHFQCRGFNKRHNSDLKPETTC